MIQWKWSWFSQAVHAVLHVGVYESQNLNFNLVEWAGIMHQATEIHLRLSACLENNTPLEGDVLFLEEKYNTQACRDACRRDRPIQEWVILLSNGKTKIQLMHR